MYFIMFDDGCFTDLESSIPSAWSLFDISRYLMKDGHLSLN